MYILSRKSLPCWILDSHAVVKTYNKLSRKAVTTHFHYDTKVDQFSKSLLQSHVWPQTCQCLCFPQRDLTKIGATFSHPLLLYKRSWVSQWTQYVNLITQWLSVIWACTSAAVLPCLYTNQRNCLSYFKFYFNLYNTLFHRLGPTYNI